MESKKQTPATAERPILFNSDMVRAILQGRKTQTRRIAKHQFWQHHELINANNNGQLTGNKDTSVNCPYGRPGDLLWVRETFEATTHELIGKNQYQTLRRIKFKADGVEKYEKWMPSIFMPKDICRIWLQVKSVRIERLGDISEEDAIAEGVRSQFIDLFQEMRWRDYMAYQPEHIFGWRAPTSSFFSLWESINGAESLAANPWIWVVEFDVLSKTIKPLTWKGKQIRIDEEAAKAESKSVEA